MSDERVIRDGEQFMRRFRIGDTFWTFSSCNGEPKGVHEIVLTGYCRLEDMYEGSRDPSAIIVLCDQDCWGHFHLSDLMNEWHGVCESLTDAEQEFERRRAAWEAHPRRSHFAGLVGL